MRRLLQSSVVACLLSLLGVSATTAQDYSGAAGRKVVCDYTIGTATSEAGGVTKQEHYFYGQDNRPVRGAQMAKGTGSDFTLSYYYTYASTEEAGQTTTSRTGKQWGLYNAGDYGFKDVTSVNESKTYNYQGQLTKHVTTSYTYLYSYDLNGYLTKETWTYTSNGGISMYISYTNDGDGRPVERLETDKNSTFKQRMTFEYNADGTLAQRNTYKRTNATKASTEYLYTEEIYTYADGMLTEILKRQGSATTTPVDKGKTVYAIYENNPNKIKVDTYNWSTSSEKWARAGVGHVYEYADFTETSGAAYAVNDVEAVQTSTGTNVDVTFTPTANDHLSYAIYRSGHLIATVSKASSYQSETGKCKFTETNVKVGEWEYFVVPFEGTTIENVTANNPHYISNVASLQILSEGLIAVQNLNWTAATEGDTHIVTVNWDANPDLANTSFLKHDLYFTRKLITGTMQSTLMATTSDATATSLSFNYLDTYDEMELYVITNYAEGNVESAHIKVKKIDLEPAPEPEPEPEPTPDPDPTEPEPDPDPEAPVVRVLAKKTWYGDSMGSVPNTQDMREMIYFYNYDGKLARTIQNTRVYKDGGGIGDYQLTRYVKAVMDENGNKVADYSYQYGLYDYGEIGHKLTSEEHYEYNENNQLIRETEGNTTYEYAYDSAGRLVEKKSISATYGLMQTITYTEFNENGDPTTYVSTGLWSYNYNGEITYDAKGNKIYESCYTVSTDEVTATPSIKFTQQDEWTYDENNQLTCYTRYLFDGQGNKEPQMRTTYTPVDDNPDRIQVVDQTYGNGKWYTQAGATCIWEYADYTNMLDPVKMTAEATSDANVPGKVDLTFTVPQYTKSKYSSLKIYRDGIEIGNVSFTASLTDPDNGICTFSDTGVKNGTHDYILLPMVGTREGDNITWKSYYICEPVSVTTETYLPPVTDLYLASASTIQTTGGKQQVISIGWTNPTDRPDGFRSNDLLFLNTQGAESSTTNANATELEAEVLLDNGNNKQVTLFVLTRYTLGNAISETITVTYQNFISPVGIDNAEADGAAFNFANKTITVDGEADIKVFSTTGRMVGAETNVSSMSLENLDNGVYLIVVNKDNALKAYKVLLK